MGQVQCCKCVTNQHVQENPSPEDQAENYYQEGKYDSALRAYKILLEVHQAKNNGYITPEVLFFHQRIGSIYEQLENHKEAMKYHTKAIQLRPKLNDQDKKNLWMSYFCVGRLQYQEERYHQALANLELAKDLNNKELEQDIDYRSIKTNRYRALCLGRLNHFEKALEILSNCLLFVENLKGRESEEAATLNDDLADTYIMMDSYNAQGNQAILKPLGLGPGVPLLQKQLFDCADSKPMYEHQEKITKYFMRGYKIRKEIFYEESVEFTQSRINLAKINVSEENIHILMDCIRILKEAYGEGNPSVIETTIELIKAQALMLEYESAHENFKQSIWHVLNDYQGDHTLLMIKLYKTIGDVGFTQGRLQEAIEHYQKCLQFSTKMYGENDLHVAQAYEDIAICFVKQRKKKGAVDNYDKALAIKTRLLGENHHSVTKLKETINHWQNFQWVALGDEISDRQFSKNLTSYRSGGDLSFNIEDFTPSSRHCDGRFKFENVLKALRILGSSAEGEGVGKWKGCQDQYMSYDVTQDSWFFSVIDGHGPDGQTAAEDLRKHLFSYLKKNADLMYTLTNDRLVGEFLRLCYKNCENALEKNPNVSVDSGCCCLSVFIQRDRWYICSTGDCKAIIGSLASDSRLGQHQGYDIGMQHRLQLEDEKARVALSGGKMELRSHRSPSPTLNASTNMTTITSRSIVLQNTYRVWKDQLGPGILATRVLGNFKAKEIGIISDPEIYGGVLDPEKDQFIVAGTDGLWDVMTTEEVTDIVSSHIAKYGLENSISGEDGQTVERILIDMARDRWKEMNSQGEIGIADNPKQKGGIDDIAVVVAFFVYDINKTGESISINMDRKSTSTGRYTYGQIA